MAVAAALAAAPSPAASHPAPQAPVVHAVLFHSPTCPHCHEVINQVLPPLRERYAERLVIVGVDVTTPNGGYLYEAAVEYYGLAPDRLGVPLLVIGDVTLLGSLEIPERLPGLIEEGLATGGTPWPSLPPLRDALAAQGLIPQASPRDSAPGDAAPPAADSPAPDAAAPVPDSTAPASAPARPAPEADTPGTRDSTPAPPPEPDQAAPPLTPGQGVVDTSLTPESTQAPAVGPLGRFLQDPVGNGIAVVVLALLLAVLVMAALSMRPAGPPLTPLPGWIVPALAVLGLGIAAYLSVVEVTGAQAVCGPVGDCNTVQQSAYARLFGVVPVGILGALGYVAILTTWSLATFGAERLREHARLATWTMAFVGTAFSAYLTFLEPFVIGATCAWCISSALIMAALLVSATHAVRQAR